MDRQNKSRRWKRWLFGTIGLLLIIVLSACGYIYYSIKQIDLADIQQRIEERRQNPDAGTGQSQLPGILDNTVDKASSLAGKSVDTQDALDVAAILLKSGLSFKEIYYLTGKSTDNLSNEEKQRIRDLLLAKLSEEEIKALRAITVNYGKTLVILDSNYPIELVGVYDPVEVDRIKKELAQKKQQAAASVAGSADAAGSGTESNNAVQPVSPAPEASSTPVTDASNTEHEALRDAYEAKLEALQSSSTGAVNNLVAELSVEINSSAEKGKPLSLSALQSKYLPKVEAAEKESDAKFEALMSDATKDYQNKDLPLQDITNWRSQYQSMKSKVQNQAMNSLLAQLTKK